MVPHGGTPTRRIGAPRLYPFQASMKKSVVAYLEPDEIPRWQSGALQSFGRVTVAGTLCVTQRRLVFAPTGLNIRRRPPWSASLGQVQSFEVADRTGEAFNGGIRRRLKVTLRDGAVELFVIKHLDAAAEKLRGFLPADS